jgi:hypothetical protein
MPHMLKGPAAGGTSKNEPAEIYVTGDVPVPVMRDKIPVTIPHALQSSKCVPADSGVVPLAAIALVI